MNTLKKRKNIEITPSLPNNQMIYIDFQGVVTYLLTHLLTYLLTYLLCSIPGADAVSMPTRSDFNRFY